MLLMAIVLFLNVNIRIVHGVQGRIVFGVERSQAAKYNYQREETYEYDYNDEYDLFLACHSEHGISRRKVARST